MKPYFHFVALPFMNRDIEYGRFMLDIYQEIRAEIENRELEYIYFTDLLKFLN